MCSRLRLGTEFHHRIEPGFSDQQFRLSARYGAELSVRPKRFAGIEQTLNSACIHRLDLAEVQNNAFAVSLDYPANGLSKRSGGPGIEVAIGFVMLATYITLFFLLGSVLLPLKAVVMNLLSITGSFGALVWIFQDGHFSRLLGFAPAPIDPSLPVVLFCTVFGLSMDYEVLLLSRIQEEYQRTGDNTRAVAEGLERSGRLIMSAALIMIAVFAAFALAEVVLIKAIGLGMAIAVALDATIVRVLIVPATMRLCTRVEGA
jgi:hypothetical protein